MPMSLICVRETLCLIQLVYLAWLLNLFNAKLYEFYNFSFLFRDWDDYMAELIPAVMSYLLSWNFNALNFKRLVL